MRKRSIQLHIPRKGMPIHEHAQYGELRLREALESSAVRINPIPDAEGVQIDGSCAYKPFGFPLIYNTTLHMPRSVMERPSAEIVVRIFPDEHDYGMPDFFAANRRIQMSVLAGQLLEYKGHLIISRSLEPAVSSTWSAKGRIPKDPADRLRILNEHGWLSLGDTIEVLIDDGTLRIHAGPVTVHQMAETQYIEMQRLYNEEALMVEKVRSRPVVPPDIDVARRDTAIIPYHGLMRNSLSDN